MVQSLKLALRRLIDAGFGFAKSNERVEASASVDPSLMPLDLTVVSTRGFALVDQPIDEIVFQQAA